MNVSCVNCQKMMVVVSTNAHEGRGNAETIYRCPTCECNICIIDDLDLTNQRLRELEIQVNTIMDG